MLTTHMILGNVVILLIIGLAFALIKLKQLEIRINKINRRLIKNE